MLLETCIIGAVVAGLLKRARGSTRSVEHAENSHRTRYRTQDGSADYAFDIAEMSNGTWRVYIEDQPSYCGRDTDAHSTHRLSDGGRKYVCWSRALHSLEDAQDVAAQWADCTQTYIRTGQTF